jgi:large conductance mechanosensitive channel
MQVLSDFKTFILRGNVVDLAVGVVIGAAFTSVVNAFTKDLLTPLIGIAGQLNFSELSFDVNGSKFLVGEFVNTIVSFLITSFVVFFFVVRPVNWMMSHRKQAANTKECPHCISKISIHATRCPNCTSQLGP